MTKSLPRHIELGVIVMFLAIAILLLPVLPFCDGYPRNCNTRMPRHSCEDDIKVTLTEPDHENNGLSSNPASRSDHVRRTRRMTNDDMDENIHEEVLRMEDNKTQYSGLAQFQQNVSRVVTVGNVTVIVGGVSNILDRMIVLNNKERIICQLARDVTGNRLGFAGARWVMGVGGIVIIVCGVCIVIFYCRCKGRIARIVRGDSFENNPRATVSVVPSRALQRPPRLNNQPALNNTSSGADAYNSQAQRSSSTFGKYQYLKALETNPERHAVDLMLNL